MKDVSFVVAMGLLLVSCSGSGMSPTAPATLSAPFGGQGADAGPGVVASDRPFEFTNEYSVPAFDPCNEVPDTLVIVETCRATVYNPERQVFTCKQEYTTTPGGYVGSGTGNFISNGHVIVQRWQVVLDNDAGDRIRGRYRWVFDPSDLTARVDDFSWVCLGR